MSPLRLPRWTALVVFPLLAGALLLMHGLDAGATTPGLAGLADHSHHGEAPTEHDDDSHCPACAFGHVMAACVAIVAAAVGIRLAPRARRAHASTIFGWATVRLRAAQQLLRPPEPAWVRLAVMRC